MQSLRFTLDFARCLMEVAGSRGGRLTVLGGRPSVQTPPPGVEKQPSGQQEQQHTLVADQISSLSREWR